MIPLIEPVHPVFCSKVMVISFCESDKRRIKEWEVILMDKVFEMARVDGL